MVTIYMYDYISSSFNHLNIYTYFFYYHSNFYKLLSLKENNRKQISGRLGPRVGDREWLKAQERGSVGDWNDLGYDGYTAIFLDQNPLNLMDAYDCM